MEPKPFFKTRFRVIPVKKSTADHWSGGEATHRGAKCPSCRIPLMLHWDLNCGDPRFPKQAFGTLERLPLYFCWSCVNELAYEVVDEDSIRICSKPVKRKKPSYQYEPYPDSFERRPIDLDSERSEEVNRIFQRIMSEWQADDDDEEDESPVPTPTASEQKILTAFFGHRVVMPGCFVHHQLGGRPINMHWAHETFRCPNPECSGKLRDRLTGKKRAMKFLAGVLNDPQRGLPLVDPADVSTKKSWNHHVSVQFHICDSCNTVIACNRCD